MKRILTIGIILLFIGMSISSSTGFDIKEQSRTATSNGKTLYVGGSGPGNYTRIQDAIDNASDGNTVFVYNGTYFEYNITINNTINLIGKDVNTTIIDGNRTEIIILTYANEINISGFTIKKCGHPEAIRIHSSNNNIHHNIMKNNRYFGVCVQSGNTNNKIHNNTFSNGDDGDVLLFSNYNYICDNKFINKSGGIALTRANNNTLIRNLFMGNHNHIGIQLTDSNYNIISKNIFINNSLCIYLFYSSHNLITENIIVNNTRAINIYGGYIFPSNNNIISKNTIANNSELGIRLSSNCKDNIITKNNIINNMNYGILVGANNNKIFKNNIKNTKGIGIYLNSSINTSIYSNNFINNKKNAEFTYYIGLFLRPNKWNQNYWDRQRLLPKPIFGRHWYHWYLYIPLVQFDWHPAQDPYDIEV